MFCWVVEFLCSAMVCFVKFCQLYALDRGGLHHLRVCVSVLCCIVLFVICIVALCCIMFRVASRVQYF